MGHGRVSGGITHIHHTATGSALLPELPEVETIRRDLEPRLLGRRITAARLFPGERGDVWNFVWHPLPARPDLLERPLQGSVIDRVGRRGKYLFVQGGRAQGAQGDRRGTLLIHLGMTGVVGIRSAGTPRPAHVRLEVELDGGDLLTLTDPRRFGRVGYWTDDEMVALPTNDLGIEPVSDAWSVEVLRRAIQGVRAPIKAVLLDQTRICGLGNIYADEALWTARIHPATPAGELTATESARLTRACRDALLRGIRNRGTTLRDYRDGEGRTGNNQRALRAYGRGGLPCRRCGTKMRALRIAGRGTTCCPACQRAPRAGASRRGGVR